MSIVISEPQATPLQILLEGFLTDRKQADGFVVHNETMTGWEKDIDVDIKSGIKTGYSTILLAEENITDTLSALKVAYRLCKTRVNVLNTTGEKLLFSFLPDRSMTTGKLVFVGTKVFDRHELSYAQKLDVVLGLTTHEMAHVLYTDFTKNHPVESELYATIENIIEDERIERHISQDTPGFSRHLEATKKYYFDFLYKAGEVETGNGEFGEIFGSFFRMVRYPSLLDESLVEKHIDVLLEIKSAMTPYPVSHADCVKASLGVFEILSRYAKDKAKSEPNEKGKPSGKSKGSDAPSDKELEEQVGKLMDKIATALSDLVSPQDGRGSKNVSFNGMVCDTLNEDNINNNIIEGTAKGVSRGENFAGDDSPVFFVKAEQNKGRYDAFRKEVLAASKLLARSLKIELFNGVVKNSGLRHGTFDEVKIVEASMGCEGVYFNIPEQKTKSMPVVLLIDESGSMHWDEKIADASRAAITFVEALKGVSVELFIYGFTSDRGPDNRHEITIYKEGSFSNVATLGALGAKDSNADGICLREVCKRVRKITPKESFLFVISDGEPASYSYTSQDHGIEDTARAVVEAEKMGFRTMQIGIGANAENQQKMFKHFVNYKDSKDMVKNIGKVLKSALTKKGK
ncbi:MAG: hypothetical protein IM631_12155 [Cytophagales bacterium]|nr:hypothetical protein [Cytophagales bacterium]MCA6372123.1 hypothetical protein [Cytophagales bacterium]MCA6382267.1 hypothetical protein [Cytophagales bacterium]